MMLKERLRAVPEKRERGPCRFLFQFAIVVLPFDRVGDFDVAHRLPAVGLGQVRFSAEVALECDSIDHFGCAAVRCFGVTKNS